jgi:hypothetical protein
VEALIWNSYQNKNLKENLKVKGPKDIDPSAIFIGQNKECRTALIFTK